MKRINSLIFGIALIVQLSYAEIIKTGYFAGLDLVPMQGARITQLDQEPAVVLIFAADANSVDATRQFDQWFRDPNRPRVNVYAVSIGPEDTSFEVISEALRQRDLQVPNFHVQGSNLLNGREYRMLVLDRGGQIRREFATLDFAALNADLGAPAPTPGAATATPAPGVSTGPAASASTTPATATSVSIDGGPAATPTPTPGAVTVEEVNSNEPVYYNQRYALTVEFPPNWSYRVARNGDGAVSKAPRGQLDLRVWAVPNTDSKSTSDYIQEFIDGIGEQNNTRASIDRRLVVEDEDVKGRDYMYSYSRLVDPNNPAGGSVRYRGRIQVFDANGTLKVAGAEAPAREFDTAANSVIEPFFLSFHPRIEPPPGATPPAGSGARTPAVAPARDAAPAPVATAPPANEGNGTTASPAPRSF